MTEKTRDLSLLVLQAVTLIVTVSWYRQKYRAEKRE